MLRLVEMGAIEIKFRICGFCVVFCHIRLLDALAGAGVAGTVVLIISIDRLSIF